MAVYVDSERNPYGRMLMCHMTADTLDELHEMADRIGIRRKWFQLTSHPHYDICQSKRALVIDHGAKVVSLRELALTARRLGKDMIANGQTGKAAYGDQ